MSQIKERISGLPFEEAGELEIPGLDEEFERLAGVYSTGTGSWNHTTHVKPRIMRAFDPAMTISLGDCETLAENYNDPKFRDYMENMCSVCEKNGGNMPFCSRYRPFRWE